MPKFEIVIRIEGLNGANASASVSRASSSKPPADDADEEAEDDEEEEEDEGDEEGSQLMLKKPIKFIHFPHFK